MIKNENDLDMLILKNGSIVMYHNTVILEEDIKWFEKSRYEILDINVQNWNSKNFHKKVKENFNFPDYYGENMNAFEDCLSDLLNKKYRGLLIVLRNIDIIAEQDRNLTEGFLGIISSISRRWLLYSQFLIGAIQSNDPDIHFGTLGGEKPLWNSDEWFDEDRRNKIIPSPYTGPPPELL